MPLLPRLWLTSVITQMTRQGVDFNLYPLQEDEGWLLMRLHRYHTTPQVAARAVITTRHRKEL